MASEEKIKVIQNGVEEEAKVVGSFELENGNEYLLYHLTDEDLHVSRVLESSNEIILDTVPEEDMPLIDEFIRTMLEEE